MGKRIEEHKNILAYVFLGTLFTGLAGIAMGAGLAGGWPAFFITGGIGLVIFSIVLATCLED